MEEYIQILIFVGAMIIMVVQQSIKEKKKPKTSPFPEGEILDEVFPNLTESEGFSPQQPLKKPAPAKKKKKHQTPIKPIETAPTVSVPSSTKGKIRISNREEARRAFIHSEIFNRKY